MVNLAAPFTDRGGTTASREHIVTSATCTSTNVQHLYEAMEKVAIL